MPRNYSNPVVGSGVYTGQATVYPKYAPLYSGVNGDAYYATSQSAFSPSWSTEVFFWDPSIESEASSNIRVNEIRFGDGYSQRYEDGINTQPLILSMIFANRPLAEALGMMHFLHEKGGARSFLYTPQAPYNQQRKFICKEFSHKQNFFNNVTVNAKFEQVF
jgi:phage-related protein